MQQKKFLVPRDARISIWGYGLSGQSILAHLKAEGYCALSLYDDRALPPITVQLLAHQGVTVYQPQDKERFLAESATIVISPGVPTREIPGHIRLVSEIQLFQQQWHRPIIGITGTAGKTTITHSITHLMNQSGADAYACGNIGIPLLTILTKEHTNSYAIAELSSFQLDQGLIAPLRLAIITNIYPNHLDHHRSYDEYVHAKCNIIALQAEAYTTLLPVALLPTIRAIGSERPPYLWWSRSRPSTDQRAYMGSADDRWYYEEQGSIWYEDRSGITRLETVPTIPGSYRDNSILTYSALHALGITTSPAAWSTIRIPAHRGTHIRTIGTISFYNDSKATIPEATYAAVEQHNAAQLVLLWGGLSKGVDRSEATRALAHKTRLMLCFGREAAALQEWCSAAGGRALSYATLDGAIADYWNTHAQPHDIVLLSPGGSSYDLFTNYEERGDYFCKLITRLPDNQSVTKRDAA